MFNKRVSGFLRFYRGLLLFFYLVKKICIYSFHGENINTNPDEIGANSIFSSVLYKFRRAGEPLNSKEFNWVRKKSVTPATLVDNQCVAVKLAGSSFHISVTN